MAFSLVGMRKTLTQAESATKRITRALAVIYLLSGTIECNARDKIDGKIEYPNIVFVLADDLGWSELGCYGNTFHETPNLDRLSREGIRFTDAYAAAPVCSPYRAALLTGQHPARIGILDYLRADSSKALETSTLPAGSIASAWLRNSTDRQMAS